MIPDTTLAEIEAAARAATEGPWEVDPDLREGFEWNNHIIGPDGNRICFMAHNPNDNSRLEAAARLITLACNNAAAMAAEIRALREALEKLTDCQPVPKVYKYTGTAEVDVESMFDVGHRHKSGEQPRDYLMSWLSMFRPFAYATKDDSWGELEKLISIVMNNYVQILVRAEAARATQKGTSDV